eukprot:TRINITY_DN3911_c0_g1_i1.p1 TRINITY_DN3911_c0_g1~~TRINITY_DN3911_c0_g1_i1.p1  ORF type:complete len:174 (+),score=17.77 TRINITY_DN3911_c0_g1_i1:101-622(+)
MGKTWLVCVDGSNNSDWAFHSAINMMNVKDDLLIILSVAELSKVRDYFGYRDDVFAKRSEDLHKKILQQYYTIATQLRVEKVKVVLASANYIGEMICETARDYKVDHIVMGSRGLGTIGQLWYGSTSKYVAEHTTCNITIVRRECFPPEEHDSKDYVCRSLLNLTAKTTPTRI